MEVLDNRVFPNLSHTLWFALSLLNGTKSEIPALFSDKGELK